MWHGAQVLRPFMLRRTKAEVETELPGKAEHIVRCGLSAWQRLWYRQITEEVRCTACAARCRLFQSAKHPKLHGCLLWDHVFSHIPLPRFKLTIRQAKEIKVGA